MTRKTWNWRASAAGRVAVLLMVIGVAACDNVEWGGLDVAVVPPPPRTGPASGDVEAGDRLPQGPILYHVTRDSLSTRMVPVGEIVDDELHAIPTGDDPTTFGDRFIAAFLREGAEFTLFQNGRRTGTMIVESAQVPTGAVCRPLPRATGRIELSGGSSGSGEFLAMARTQAPQGRMIPGSDSIQVERRMQVVGNILAERALRARQAPLPNWSRARRQLQPFPVSEARDLGFTATFLVDDELAVGNDDQGYSLFIVYTPQAQTGYDTAYVDYTSYTAEGKAAPRTIDFLDWDRDGQAELLLEVFGTTDRWYAAVGPEDGEWSRIFEDWCDERPAAVATDSAVADSAAAPGTTTPTTTPAPGAASTNRQTPTATSQPAQRTEIPDIEPRIELSDPNAPARRDTTPRRPAG